MKAFFEKYPVDMGEIVAIKMIHHKIEEVEKLCKKNDEDYLEELAKVHEMISYFFQEKGVNPAQLL